MREMEAQRFAGLIDQIDGVVWEADAATFQFTFAGSAATRLLGYTTDAWLAAGFWEEHRGFFATYSMRGG